MKDQLAYLCKDETKAEAPARIFSEKLAQNPPTLSNFLMKHENLEHFYNSNSKTCLIAMPAFRLSQHAWQNMNQKKSTGINKIKQARELL